MARFVRRKWGWYFVLLDFKQFKIKLLRFYEGKRLSLQYHNLRNELWLWLSGGGFFSRNGDVQVMGSGKYALVESGVEHTYMCALPSWIIEVQFGEKCDETDIVRF